MGRRRTWLTIAFGAVAGALLVALGWWVVAPPRMHALTARELQRMAEKAPGRTGAEVAQGAGAEADRVSIDGTRVTYAYERLDTWASRLVRPPTLYLVLEVDSAGVVISAHVEG